MIQVRIAEVVEGAIWRVVLQILDLLGIQVLLRVLLRLLVLDQEAVI
jgi:hypothetical protein